jgi:hypothetical protein
MSGILSYTWVSSDCKLCGEVGQISLQINIEVTIFVIARKFPAQLPIQAAASTNSVTQSDLNCQSSFRSTALQA